jgi:DUF2075 family protein
MIVYSATRQEFTADVFANQIERRILDAFQTRLKRSVSTNEVAAWRSSMQHMNNVLVSGDVAPDAGVAIEYTIPLSAKRIDFILTGRNDQQRDTAMIIELKQWTEAKATNRDAIVETVVGGRMRESTHPSYQAWTYASLIRDYNEAAQDDRIQLIPCAYLHNCITPECIRASFYKEHTERAPAFLKDDAERLTQFIQQHVRYGDSSKILYRIENGRIRPSKNLADHLVALLHGNREFLMIDDQKIAYERALALAVEAKGSKQVLIVEGGPGTGKSVVAINLLVELTRRELLAQYATRNAAPRAVYEAKLAGSFKKTHITNLFRSTGAYTETDAEFFDALIVDEAHRLNAKSGMYQNMGENQILEIIRAAKLSVFFIDEDQRVTIKDIGESAEIRKFALKCGASVHELKLSSQFRCNGSDGYLAWVDNALQIRETANRTLEGIDYAFRVFDDPNELFSQIVQKNQIKNKARVVAGYCWDWKGKKDPAIRDVALPEHGFAKRWNLGSDGGLWIVKPESVNEIGCIHTCQGLELDYVGVIIGPDLVVRDGKIRTDAGKRSRQDSSVRGYKAMLKKEPGRARAIADRIVKNTYRTLMTRGQKGCFLFCVDAETQAYFKDLCAGNVSLPAEAQGRYPGLSLRLLSREEVRPYENAVPIFDLEMAAACDFSQEQHVEEHDWVELPDSFRPQPGHFVTRVVGESMNRRIPNGSWCLFRANPGGSRQGKVVIVQHRSIEDSETGTHCTIKVYFSEKEVGEDGWKHQRISLRPDSTREGYRAIELDPASAEDLRVVGELIAVLS